MEPGVVVFNLSFQSLSIFSNRRHQCLFNAKDLNCVACWKAVLKRGKRLFQIKMKLFL